MTRLLLSVIATATAGTLPAFLFGGLAVQVRSDLGFDEVAQGLAFGAFFAAAALSSMLLGRVSERLGPARSLRSASAAGACVQIGIAVAARSWASLSVGLALAGVVTALIQPAANLALARAIPRHRQGLAFGVKQAAIPLATLFGGLAVPAFALTVGWRWAFVAGAGFALTAALSVPPSFPEQRAPAGRGGSGVAPAGALAALAVGIGCGAAAAGSVGSFLVSTGVKAGLDEATAGLALSMGSVLGITARLSLGALADYRIRDPLRVVAALMVCGSAAFAMLAVGVAWVHLLATALAFGAGWAWPGLFNLAVVLASPDKPGAATGVTQTGTYVGAVTGPLVFGLVADRASYAAAWSLTACFALLAAIAVLEGRRRLLAASRDVIEA